MKFVILAGGSGTRLWPISRSSNPKQFSRLVGELTMLQDTVRRLKPLAGWDQIYISTNATFAPMIRELLPELSDDHIIVEPEKRDTGPATALAAARLSLDGGDEPMVLLPSDHYIKDEQMFVEVFRVAEALIIEQGTMVNVGITPTYPNVNLGYLNVGPLLEDRKGIHIHEFAGQKEKPDYNTARSFIDQGNYLWNAGYFAWTPHHFLEAYRTFAPDIGAHLDALVQAMQSKDESAFAAAYGKMEAKSIDYAVIEKMDPASVRTIRGDFGWADLGSWDMLYNELANQTDEQGNLIKANWHGVDTRNTLVYAPSEKLVTTIGVSDLAIIDTPDALLVTPMSRAQDVKKIVELLKERGLEQHL